MLLCYITIGENHIKATRNPAPTKRKYKNDNTHKKNAKHTHTHTSSRLRPPRKRRCMSKLLELQNITLSHIVSYIYIYVIRIVNKKYSDRYRSTKHASRSIISYTHQVKCYLRKKQKYRSYMRIIHFVYTDCCTGYGVCMYDGVILFLFAFLSPCPHLLTLP